MMADQSIKENLKYLDDILSFLINSSHNYRLSFEELYEKVNKRDFKTDNGWNKEGYFLLLSSNERNPFELNITNNTQALGEKLVEALYFLNQEGLVRLSVDIHAKATFKGIIQYSKTFVADHKKIQSDRLLNKWNIYITIFLTLIGLLAGLLIGK
jgi:hypothetical protein